MLRALTDRNFFALLGTYLAVGFGVLQFIEFLANRYGLDPAFIDRYLIVWLVSLPAVAILAYYRGSGADRPRWPHWVVPANLLLSLLLAVVLVRSADEQESAPGTDVTFRDETGAQVTATVPGQRQIKYVSVFAFDNASGSDSLDWWGPVVGDLLAQDLRQQPDFYPQPATRLVAYYNGQGVPPYAHLSVATQRTIAREARTAYYVSGSFAREGGTFRITGQVLQTRDGKAIVELAAAGPDPLAVIDVVSEQIVAGLPRPAAPLAGASDLPVASLWTESLEALRYYAEAERAFVLDPGDVEGALRSYRRAAQADPRCAVCAASVANMLYGLGRQDSAMQVLERAARLASDLPRRDQIEIRGMLYAARGSYDEYFQLMELSRKLYPYDYGAYQALLPRYTTTYGLDSAKALMREAVRNGHEERGLLNLYNLHLQDKDYEQARATLDRFFEAFPERTDDRIRYVTLYELQNMPERAAQELQELITLDPFNLSYRFTLADMEVRSGQRASAVATYRTLLADGDNRQDSVRAYNTLAGVYTSLGQVKESDVLLDEMESFLARILPPNRVLTETFRRREVNYLYTGRRAPLDSLLTEIGRYGVDMDRIYACATELDRVQLLPQGAEDATSLRACYPTLRKAQYTESTLDVVEAYLEEDYAKAAGLLSRAEGEESASQSLAKLFQARVFRLAGDVRRAEELLRENMDIYKDEPNTLVELYLTTGNADYLEAALDTWATADDDFIPALQARELWAARE